MHSNTSCSESCTRSTTDLILYWCCFDTESSPTFWIILLSHSFLHALLKLNNIFILRDSIQSRVVFHIIKLIFARNFFTQNRGLCNRSVPTHNNWFRVAMIVLCAFILSLLIYLWDFFARDRRKLKLAKQFKGPFAIPLLGNLYMYLDKKPEGQLIC